MIVVMRMEIVEVMHIVRSKVRNHKRRPLFKLQLMNSVSCTPLISLLISFQIVVVAPTSIVSMETVQFHAVGEIITTTIIIEL